MSSHLRKALTRRAFTLGEQSAGVAHFYAADHLESVREVTNASSTLLARYAYDAWGRRSVTTGTDVTKIGYTGHQWQTTGSLWLTQFRGYDADLARWLTEDPAGLGDDPNLFAYVGNNPISRVDPLGLQWTFLPKPRQQQETKDGIETFWTSCEQGKKLYHKDARFNVARNQAKWRGFVRTFIRECGSQARPCYTNNAYWRESNGIFGLNSWGVCVCCEVPRL